MTTSTHEQPPTTDRLNCHVPIDVAAWLRDRAERNDRTLTGELTHLLKAQMERDRHDERVADREAVG